MTSEHNESPATPIDIVLQPVGNAEIHWYPPVDFDDDASLLMLDTSTLDALLHNSSPDEDQPNDSNSPALAPPKPRGRLVRLCTIPGCSKFAQRHTLCFRHGGRRSCQSLNCTKKDRGNGFCVAHGGGELCSVEICTRRARVNHLCNKHNRK